MFGKTTGCVVNGSYLTWDKLILILANLILILQFNSDRMGFIQNETLGLSLSFLGLICGNQSPWVRYNFAVIFESITHSVRMSFWNLFKSKMRPLAT